MKKKDGEYKTNKQGKRKYDGKPNSNQQITRSNKIPRKTNNLATVNNIRQFPTEKQKKIFIVGDSMIKNITGTGISRDHTVKIRPRAGATSIDMSDYKKPELRHQPDVIILHCEANDISNEINALKKLKKLLKEIEGYDTHKKPQVVISSLIKRYYQDFNEDIKSINEKIPRLCTSKGLSFIDNSNIHKSCLNRSKPHLNRRGSSFLANSFKKFVNSLCTSDPFTEIFRRTHEHPTNSLAELKSLRIRNHNNVTFSYLNINSIRNKFDNLKLIIDKHVDILCVAETNSFPTA